MIKIILPALLVGSGLKLPAFSPARDVCNILPALLVGSGLKQPALPPEALCLCILPALLVGSGLKLESFGVRNDADARFSRLY